MNEMKKKIVPQITPRCEIIRNEASIQKLGPTKNRPEENIFLEVGGKFQVSVRNGRDCLVTSYTTD